MTSIRITLPACELPSSRLTTSVCCSTFLCVLSYRLCLHHQYTFGPPLSPLLLRQSRIAINPNLSPFSADSRRLFIRPCSSASRRLVLQSYPRLPRPTGPPGNSSRTASKSSSASPMPGRTKPGVWPQGGAWTVTCQFRTANRRPRKSSLNYFYKRPERSMTRKKRVLSSGEFLPCVPLVPAAETSPRRGTMPPLVAHVADDPLRREAQPGGFRRMREAGLTQKRLRDVVVAARGCAPRC